MRYASYGNAGVTQLVECLLPKQDVVGSSPIARSFGLRTQSPGAVTVCGAATASIDTILGGLREVGR